MIDGSIWNRKRIHCRNSDLKLSSSAKELPPKEAWNITPGVNPGNKIILNP